MQHIASRCLVPGEKRPDQHIAMDALPLRGDHRFNKGGQSQHKGPVFVEWSELSSLEAKGDKRIPVAKCRRNGGGRLCTFDERSTFNAYLSPQTALEAPILL